MYNFSEERLSLAVKMIFDNKERLIKLPENAQVVYALGFLVCSDSGFIDREDLDKAANDDSAINAARQLLIKAGM